MIQSDAVAMAHDNDWPGAPGPYGDPLVDAIIAVRLRGWSRDAEGCARAANEADRLLAGLHAGPARGAAWHAVFAIVAIAVSRMRARAAANDAAGCADEADHVHNLVAALVKPHPDTLRYYWYCERPLDEPVFVAAFEQAWATLAPHVPSRPPTT